MLFRSWPEADKRILVQDDIEMVVQVNGKLRGQIRVVKEAEREAIERIALDNAQVQKFVAGHTIKKIVVVPGRLVNIVI